MVIRKELSLRRDLPEQNGLPVVHRFGFPEVTGNVNGYDQNAGAVSFPGLSPNRQDDYVPYGR